MLERLLTIGVYGFTERAFFRALVESGADLFCDVRARRGVRGARYAFANATRLQASLAKRGIRYVHCKGLAPSEKTRKLQEAADKAGHVARRKRNLLSPAFIKSYKAERLSRLKPARLVKEELAGASAPVFFCVEREPEACHRSLLVEKLSRELDVPVRHIRPSE
jgi:uncharacterized protein (DUF488 family)